VKKAEITSFLREVYFFKDLEVQDFERVAQAGKIVKYPGKEIIFREHDAADYFYVIQEGSVEIWKDYGFPAQNRLSILGSKQIFGEMALVDDLDRSATVITREACTLLRFSHADFQDLMEDNPKVMLAILRSLSGMMRKSNDDFVQNLSKQNAVLQKTNQELKEAQSELLRAERFSNLGKFASFILHDLRNPIAMIRGYAEMIVLSVSDSDSAINNYSHKIIQEADQVNRIANELLDYSRGEVRLNYGLTTVDALFGKLFSYAKEAFERKNLELTFSNTVHSPLLVDTERLLRVLVNVLDNARKACNAGAKITVSAEEKGNDVLFDITDQGEGMSEEVKARIFEPFYSSSKKGGTGLGLLIVKNIVEAHQGQIQVDSTLDLGTSIKIRLPLKP